MDVEKPIASTRHFVIFGAICLVFAALALSGRPPWDSAVSRPSESNLVSLYLGTIAGELFLLFYVWRGMRRGGGNLFALAGRWRSPLAVGSDLLFGVVLGLALVALDAFVQHLFGGAAVTSVASLLPQTPLEIAVWVMVSVVAGVAEEFVFRGYLMRQLRTRLKSVPLAIVAQALWFSVMHAYEGLHAVVPICAIGLVFGFVAAWREQLRTNIVAHACVDLIEGLAPNLIRF